MVDLNQGKVISVIAGLKQPQGVGYHQSTDTLYVANAGDGSVRMFRSSDYSEVGRIDLKEDADNIRLDGVTDRIIVGYGNGALAVIDPKSRSKIADILLKGHPEGFQLDAKSQQIFVNVPDDHAISVIDRGTSQVGTNWPTSDARGNFPMAIDEASSQVFVVFRSPAKLRTYSMQTGKAIDELKVCSDSDDVFFDAKRRRIYVSCGTGFVDVVDASGTYKRVVRISTASRGENLALCARTGSALSRGSKRKLWPTCTPSGFSPARRVIDEGGSRSDGASFTRSYRLAGTPWRGRFPTMPTFTRHPTASTLRIPATMRST